MTISEPLFKVAGNLLNPLIQRIKGTLRQGDGQIPDKGSGWRITKIWKYCYLRIKCCPANSLAALMWRWCLNSKQAVLQLREEGLRRGEMRQGNSQHLTHTWMEKMVQKPYYIMRKGIQRRWTEEKQKKSERLNKYNSKKKELYTIDHTIRAWPRMLFVLVYV